MKSVSRPARATAFTLIELLVVVAIIALLISILLPSLNRARQQARAVVCQTNLRSLSQAAWTYAMEYGVYPPSLSNYAQSSNDAIRSMRYESGVDWLGIGDFGGGTPVPGDPNDPDTGNPRGFAAAPTQGKLYPLVKEEDAYLCPSERRRELGQGTYDTLLGGPGNGKFSYTMFAMMGIRQPERIPARPVDRSGPSRGASSTSGQKMHKPRLPEVPLFVEEHPGGINGISIDGNFNLGTDKVVSRHPPYSVREGIQPGESSIRTFRQGTTQIGFADGHVEPVKVNFGADRATVREEIEGGIPYDSAGILWYYGIEYDEERSGETLIKTIE
jgi:prepilin-type N-terminal cleavage/methylation domain-containing protein/prepilin-type processing-associated H-X9-DG protein